MKVRLKHPTTNVIKNGALGFSLGTLLIGPFDALFFRGDVKWFFIMLIANAFTFLLGWLVFCFIYNKIHLKDLLSKGFVPVDEATKHLLIQKGYIVA
jgi:biotin transporter BioY